MTFRRVAPYFFAVTSVLLAALWLHAGPLNPPGGPVTGTYKTLTEVEPRIAVNAANTPGDASSLYIITQPGSYYLVGNIAGVAGKHGINIAATGVTLDLSGFDIAGVGAASAVGDGIHVSAAGNGVHIRNGTLRDWPEDGLSLSGAVGAQVSGVTSSSNRAAGFNVGTNTGLSDCVANANLSIGFATSSGCTLTKCSSASNALDGFLLGSGSTITGCTAYLNQEDGIQVNNGCTVCACTCYANTADGIEVATGSTIVNNTCRNNGFGAGNGAGIHISGEDNRIDGNNCTGADRGIDIDFPGNIVVRNSCSGNTANWDIVAGNYILVVNAIAAGAFTGASGGTALGSTDPNANFSY